MSKLDRFLVSEGIFVTFPTILAICLDRYLSDHRPILLNEIHTDYGLTPFRVYHSWFKREGFDALVENAWNSFTHNDSNQMICFKKKLQDLKKIIRVWIMESNASQVGAKKVILYDLVIIDKNLDKAVNCFFDKGRFLRGSNSSFIALIPKVIDAKFVTDFCPISLIGSVYKVVTKILANRLTTVISGLISNTQSTFAANRHILDGPFILNEDYISGLITHWNGETIVLGDFNEVHSEDERFGSIFHQSYAREFNHFISSSGLLEVKMEGYSFTGLIHRLVK
nr:RNA-directed DNA polymerase, eukaryota [Tanacetum cinerariifolium]